MTRTIEINGKIYALATTHCQEPALGKTEWFGKSHEPLQGSRMHYNADTTFKTHKHKLNPRIINHTQECFVVVRGKIEIEIWEGVEQHENLYLPLGCLTARAGEAIFVYDGFHKLKIVENDTICYEIKCGQFTSVEQDKIFAPELDKLV